MFKVGDLVSFQNIVCPYTRRCKDCDGTIGTVVKINKFNIRPIDVKFFKPRMDGAWCSFLSGELILLGGIAEEIE